jgi:hypothetical protein
MLSVEPDAALKPQKRHRALLPLVAGLPDAASSLLEPSKTDPWQKLIQAETLPITMKRLVAGQSPTHKWRDMSIGCQ